MGTKTIEQMGGEHGFSPNSFYVWKRKYGSMSEPDVKRLRELEKENARLKRLLAERELAIDVMKEFLEKSGPDVEERRKLAACFAKEEISLTRACELLGISRRRLKYASRREDGDLTNRLKELATRIRALACGNCVESCCLKTAWRKSQTRAASVQAQRLALEVQASAKAAGDCCRVALPGGASEPCVGVRLC